MVCSSRMIVHTLILSVFLFSGNPFTVDAEPEANTNLSFPLGRSWQCVISPGSDLYPRYIADPIRPGIALTRLNVSDSEIPDVGDTRYLIRVGGRHGLFRIHPASFSDWGFQLDFEGAFLGQFDIDNYEDSIGWDGLYGALLTWSNGKGFALKLATKHDSSHVGDEYAEDTGRKRINYTRQELVFGVSLAALTHWRLYGEAGYGWDLRNEDLQEPWRVKGGLEFENTNLFWKGQAGYYAAIDVTATEELEWQKDMTIQAGLALSAAKLTRTYRLGVEYRDGRSVMGEFFQHHETYFAFGLWIEL